MSSMDHKPLVIILMGPPGAGKGTHASPLSQHLGFPHISTGDLFRNSIKTGTALGVLAKGYIDQGLLVPDELVLGILFQRVDQPDCKNGYILDGFPRTIAQALKLEEHLKNLARVVVLNFSLPDSILIERITGRLICKECALPFHKKFAKPKVDLCCDHCGGALYQRDDDKEAIVVKRLEVYRNQTAPLIAHYSKEKGLLVEIDSLKEKEAVFESVLDALPILRVC
jgi:adenylate kinase